ncbi:transcriptional regulator [Thermococcus nautili]|uniref:Transcriptional regulators n=1 Tax=Thermococcus nautili TaxID=195522 RepID=W8P2C7_9EURY|nr:transcriptional regulator [Thermococcus nautili]AHL22931.1 Transcriptional regulators [Thermococcus nautili]CAI1492610.1 Transcriptional regulators [Thermococcus nautili]
MIEELAKLSKSPLGNPTRLAIALYLLSRERATFAGLRKALNLTAGNLEFHLKALEDAGIVRTYYGFGKRPRKFVELTEEGVEELSEVLRVLREAVGDG